MGKGHKQRDTVLPFFLPTSTKLMCTITTLLTPEVLLTVSWHKFWCKGNTHQIPNAQESFSETEKNQPLSKLFPLIKLFTCHWIWNLSILTQYNQFNSGNTPHWSPPTTCVYHKNYMQRSRSQTSLTKKPTHKLALSFPSPPRCWTFSGICNCSVG